MKAVIHNNEEITMLYDEERYEVILRHDLQDDSKSNVADFTMLFLHKETDTILYPYKFMETPLIVARELAKRCIEYLSQSDIKIGLLVRGLGETLGFRADLSRGIDYFFAEVAKNSDKELLELYLQEVTYEPHKNAVENELKKRSLEERKKEDV